MRVLQLLVFSILIPLPSFAQKTCESDLQRAAGGIQSLGNHLTTALQISSECAQQEIGDLVLDPFRLQSTAMKMCAENFNCVRFLKSEAARVSRLPVENFDHLNTVALWGEILKHSGATRIRPPQLDELPLNKSPLEVFEKLKQEKLSGREINKSESLRLACLGLAAMIGPGKFKAVTALNQTSKVFRIQQSHHVEKLISKNRLPKLVEEKFQKWVSEVEKKGLDEVRKVPGYHDEPIRSLPGRRSVRLGDGFRACYESVIENSVTILKIITISSDHRDSAYCR